MDDFYEGTLEQLQLRLAALEACLSPMLSCFCLQCMVVLCAPHGVLSS